MHTHNRMTTLGYRFFAVWIASAWAASWSLGQSEVRAYYLPVFSYSSPSTASKLDAAVDKALAYNFNQLFIQVRSRADAYYYPNRDDTTYPNPEPRTVRAALSPADIDALQYVIDRARVQSAAQGKQLQVHAWINTYNCWDREVPPDNPNHLYYTHPEWVTERFDGTTLTYTQEMFLDPGRAEVQDHLAHLALDIIRNYDVDGLHFDYIRLVATDSGYDPAALARFRDQTGWNAKTDPGALTLYQGWVREQISALVGRVYRQAKREKPWVQISAFTVDFTDSVVNLAQGYNQWTQRGWIDFIMPGSYTSSWTTSLNTYNRKLSYTRPPGATQPARPITMALGAEDEWNNTPTQMRSFVTQYRALAVPPRGFAFFAYRGLSQNNDARFKGLSDPGGVFTAPVAVPPLPHAIADTVAPMAPRNVTTTTPYPAVARVAFLPSLPAADAERPVQYRIYRGTSASVLPVYSNLRMVFWDVEQSRAAFSWDDHSVVPGVPYWYRVEGYDDAFNVSPAVTVGPVTATSGAGVVDVIVNDSDAAFSTTGSWVVSGGAGSYQGDERWAISGGSPATARWQPTLALAGEYEVYVWYRADTNRAPDAPYTVVAPGVRTTIRVDQRVNGGQWVSLGTFAFHAGASGYVELSDDAGPNVVVADAVRWRWTGATAPVGWETKPLLGPDPVSPLLPGQSITVDSEPLLLNYVDGSAWETSTFGNNYGQNTRFLRPPSTSKAMYAVHLPTSGTYRIDAYLRNSTFTERAFYRYVDANGAVVTRGPLSQRLRGEGFVLQVTPAGGAAFHAGPVYVTVYTDATSSDVLIADALRFTLLESAGGRPSIDLH